MTENHFYNLYWLLNVLVPLKCEGSVLFFFWHDGKLNILGGLTGFNVVLSSSHHSTVTWTLPAPHFPHQFSPYKAHLGNLLGLSLHVQPSYSTCQLSVTICLPLWVLLPACLPPAYRLALFEYYFEVLHFTHAFTFYAAICFYSFYISEANIVLLYLLQYIYLTATISLKITILQRNNMINLWCYNTQHYIK